MLNIFVLILFSLFLFSVPACREEPQTLPHTITPSQADNIYRLYAEKGRPLGTGNFSKKFPSGELNSDLLILREVLKEAQTSLYRYRSPREIDSCFSAALSGTGDSLDYLDFISELGRIFHFIGCGHSGWSHHPDFYKFRENHMVFFPADILVADEKYFISCDLSGANLPAFTEVLSINGKTPAEITPMLKSCMPVDGAAATEGRAELARFFRIAYANFIARPDSFVVTLRLPGEASLNEKVIYARTLGEIDSLKKHRSGVEADDNKPLDFEITNPPNSAVYTVRSFRNEVIEGMGLHFTSFNDSVFARLEKQNIQNLVIDLRGNTGGWTANGKHLFSYFINDTLSYVTKVEVKKTGNYRFAPLIKKWPGYHDTMDMRLQENGLYEWRNYPSLLAVPAQKNRYRDNVYLLTDDMTNSCATAFSAMMRSHTNAVFVGEETGGAQCGSNAMVMTVQLPFSGVMVNFSTALYRYNVKDPFLAAGVLPHHTVKNKIADLKNGSDIQMETVFALIKTHNQQKNDGS